MQGMSQHYKNVQSKAGNSLGERDDLASIALLKIIKQSTKFGAKSDRIAHNGNGYIDTSWIDHRKLCEVCEE